jgi:DNA-binding FrmR family transcriptional regulator
MIELHADEWERRLSDTIDRLIFIAHDNTISDQEDCNARAVQLTACQLVLDTYIKTMHMRHAKETQQSEREDKREGDSVYVMSVADYLQRYTPTYKAQNNTGDQSQDSQEET